MENHNFIYQKQNFFPTDDEMKPRFFCFKIFVNLKMVNANPKLGYCFKPIYAFFDKKASKIQALTF